jgi:hypothetical protein
MMMKYKDFAFRVLFIYFFLQAVPLDWKYYQQLFSIDWSHLRYGAIFDLAHYEPRWSSGPPAWSDWVILLGIALVGAIIWTAAEARGRWTISYDNLYYWLRVIVRYRLAIGMIAYGFIKLFPLQSPYPSISNLNTNYGDFTRWKLFSLSLGVVPSYESFLGAVEIIGGLLLFYRRSASVGAFIIAIFLGNVFMSNLAYGGGDDVYSLYLISLALFVLSYDAQRLLNLLLLQKPAAPNSFHPVFRAGGRYVRLALKTAFIFFFVILYGFKTRSGETYQFPLTKGLPGAAGVYNVSRFIVGKDTIAYSKTDSTRWQDVVFEKWATLSIRSNRPVALDSNNVERPELPMTSGTYELAGIGREALLPIYCRYRRPSVDVAEQKPALQRMRNGCCITTGPAELQDHPVRCHDDRKDSVYAVLDRVDKKYLLEEARKKGRQGTISL